MQLILVPVERLETQQALFELPGELDLERLRFRGPVACAAAGISYRQLDYWARTDLVTPSIRNAQGFGSARLYSFGDILMLQVVRRLLDSGVSLPNIRLAIKHLRGVPTAELSGLTLLSDGATVYTCPSASELTDIVRGGQGVFGIALGGVYNHEQGELAHLPGERPGGDRVGTDELALRRARRAAV